MLEARCILHCTILYYSRYQNRIRIAKKKVIVVVAISILQSTLMFAAMHLLLVYFMLMRSALMSLNVAVAFGSRVLTKLRKSLRKTLTQKTGSNFNRMKVIEIS